MTAAVKLPKTMRLDKTDDYVFENAATAGEWAVSGVFEFVDLDPDGMSAKQRLAFTQGFLGLGGFGRSTFVAVSSAEPSDIGAAADALARHLVKCYGAPTHEAALAAAREEVEFAANLCADYPVNQLLLVARELEDDGIREGFRAAERPGRLDHAKVWILVPDDEAVPDDETAS